jgi:hypothetical protein
MNRGWQLVGLAIEFLSALVVIWLMFCAYDYFTAYYDVLALAGACNGC